MKDQRSFAAGIGFAFVAAWIAFGFGDALLCLLGAVVFWIVAGVLTGSVDLGELQGRLRRQGDEDVPVAPAPSRGPSPRAGGQSRVR